MTKDDRSPLNPFTGKKHYDKVNDDKFLEECYQYYYQEVNQYELLDHTKIGQEVINITGNLIKAVEDYLTKIGRIDYTAGYYDWEVHLVNSDIANACCFPGGKIIVYKGILSAMENDNDLAFVLGHEISHALLDHSRTSASIEQSKNTVTSASWFGTFALDLMGLGEVGNAARMAINAADMGSHFFLTQPWGRDHELEADKLGLIISYLAGYDVTQIPEFWEKFSSQNANELDFFSTHPSDSKRIAVMRESLYEVYNQQDFYSKPLLPETPKAKKEYKTKNISMPQMNTQQAPTASSFSTSQSNTTNINCPNCGNQINSNDHFCTNCGFNITKKFCTNCGKQIKSEDKFCTNCGQKI